MKPLFSLALLTILFIPIITIAAGLVPCGSPGESACQLCDFITLLDNIVDWLVMILSIVVAIVFVVSGLQLVISTGDVSAKESAKKRIANTVIGFVIVLTAWLLIDLGMKSLLAPGNASSGPWNKIQCTAQPVMAPPKTYIPTNTPGYRACPDNLSITNSATTQPVTVYHGTPPLPDCNTILANPSNYQATTQTVTWTSSNGVLASVSPDGTITTHPKNWSGFTPVVITGTYEDGSVAEVLVYGGGNSNPQGTNPGIKSECRDPGTSRSSWRLPSSCGQGDVVVVNHALADQTHLPGGGDRVWSGSMVPDQVIAVRNYFEVTTDYLSVSIRSAESGENSAAYTMALSRISGSFDYTYDENGNKVPLPSVCEKTGQLSPTGSIIGISPRIRELATNKYCPLDPNTMYYVNVKAVSPGCGTSLECRLQVFTFWPHTGEDQWVDNTPVETIPR